jgi:hypothetical protein
MSTELTASCWAVVVLSASGMSCTSDVQLTCLACYKKGAKNTQSRIQVRICILRSDERHSLPASPKSATQNHGPLQIMQAFSDGNSMREQIRELVSLSSLATIS